MPNRYVRDANGVLVPKILLGGLPDGIVVNADIANDSITDAKINSSASIAQSKLALDITNTEVNASAGIAYSKLALTDSIVNADIADAGKIQAGKISYFKSTEQVGNGSPQNIAHGLGRTPALVIVIPTELTGIGSIVEGAHDSTNAVVTAVSGDKYIVVAL